MGKEFSIIDKDLAAWVGKQQMFFVATAPLAADGLVNCSPKGRDTLRIIGPAEVAYLDLGGSGIETVAHIKQNGRIVVMLCAFEGPPRIVRFHGRGEVLEPGMAGFDALLQVFPPPPSPARSLIRIQVERISDSCGFGVPRYAYQGQRSSIENYVRDKRPEELEAYKAEHNRKSLDGLPGLDI